MVPTAPVEGLRSPSRAKDLDWDLLSPGPECRKLLVLPPSSLPPLPGGLPRRSQRFMEGVGVGPRGRPGLWALDRVRSEGPVVEPKTMKNYEIGSTPVLLGVHRETIISVFFYSYSPEGPLCPVPELHKNVSCREARDLLGPPSPSHHRVSSWFVFVLFDFVFFIW